MYFPTFMPTSTPLLALLFCFFVRFSNFSLYAFLGTARYSCFCRYRWIDYQYVDEETEREHIRKAVEITQKVCGKRPVGLYQGKTNPNTRK